MRAQHLIVIAALGAAFAAPASAQAVKKVEAKAHHVLQSTGKGIKEGAKSAGSTTHHVLQKAGNGTKTALGNATGIHKVGGSVGAAAQKVSRTGKHLGRSAKHKVKTGKAKIHRDLTKAGKDTKAQVKPEH